MPLIEIPADYYMRLLNYLAKRLVAVGIIAILKTLIFSFRMPRILSISCE